MIQNRFVVLPGYITSKHDGDVHHITFNDLCRLYDINPRDVMDGKVRRGTRLPKYPIMLSPRYDGEYNLADEVAGQIEFTYIPLGRKEGILNTKEKINQLTFFQRVLFAFTKKLPVEVFKYGYKLW